MKIDLTGRVALITGGTGHLGSAMARALAEAGASVVLTSRDAGRARESAAALPIVGAASHHGIDGAHGGMRHLGDDDGSSEGEQCAQFVPDAGNAVHMAHGTATGKRRGFYAAHPGEERVGVARAKD